MDIALERTDLSSQDLTYYLEHEQQICILESSLYSILAERGLITSPAYIFMVAGDEFTSKTNHVHEMWQTDFNYFKIIG